MKVYLATDHAGFQLKEVIKEFLQGEGYEVEDCGAHSFDKNDDYPDFIRKAGEKISSNPFDRAIIFGGNGQGENFTANKYPHVRSVVFYGPKEPRAAVDATGKISSDPYEMVRLAREHNDANILSLAARFLQDGEAIEAVRLFLVTPFSEAERHKRRLQKLADIEKELYE